LTVEPCDQSKLAEGSATSHGSPLFRIPLVIALEPIVVSNAGLFFHVTPVVVHVVPPGSLRDLQSNNGMAGAVNALHQGRKAGRCEPQDLIKKEAKKTAHLINIRTVTVVIKRLLIATPRGSGGFKSSTVNLVRYNKRGEKTRNRKQMSQPHPKKKHL
jgi:hypothetical protein